MLRALRFVPCALSLLIMHTADACPFCSDSLWDPSQAAAQSHMAQGYAVTILGMIMVPLLLSSWRRYSR